MQQEAARGDGALADDGPQRTPRADAVDCGGEIPLRGDGELCAEALGLRGDVVAFDPAIEADFADARTGMRIEKIHKRLAPGGAASVHMPRVEPERRQHPRHLRGERGDRGPVVLARAVHDCAAHAERGQLREKIRTPRQQARVVEMVVRVEQRRVFHRHASVANPAASCRILIRTAARPAMRVPETIRARPRSSMSVGSNAITSSGVAPS